MSSFMDQARDLLNAALHADTAPDLTIIITEDGSLRMFSASDWPLDSLAREHGAQSAYRLTGTSRGVTVEAREGRHRCVLEGRRPRTYSGPN